MGENKSKGTLTLQLLHCLIYILNQNNFRFMFFMSVRRMTPKVLIYAKPLLASPNPNLREVPWRVLGT